MGAGVSRSFYRMKRAEVAVVAVIAAQLLTLGLKISFVNADAGNYFVATVLPGGHF